MASTAHDDAFHEIQLNGKQLFFLFMAATVVSVVIFLCGVLVGRGVRAERTSAADLEAQNSSPSADAPPAGSPGSSSSLSSGPSTAGADPAIVPPPPPAEEIFEVSPNAPVAEPAKNGSQAKSTDTKTSPEKPAPKAEKPPAARAVPEPKPVAADKPAPKPAAVVPPAAKPPVAAPVGAPPPLAAAMPPAAGSAPGSDNYAVQVAALNTRNDADSYAKNLSSKGYSAYVVPPMRGETVFRVRVGTFKNRQDANVMADKLRKEMSLKPFVTH